MNQGAKELEQSSFRIGRIEVKYHVREPSPDNWNAVGVIYVDESEVTCIGRCPMVVGLGTSYNAAVADLIARVLEGNHSDLPDTATTEELALTSETSAAIHRSALAATWSDATSLSR